MKLAVLGTWYANTYATCKVGLKRSRFLLRSIAITLDSRTMLSHREWIVVLKNISLLLCPRTQETTRYTGFSKLFFILSFQLIFLSLYRWKTVNNSDCCRLDFLVTPRNNEKVNLIQSRAPYKHWLLKFIRWNSLVPCPTIKMKTLSNCYTFLW